MTQRVLGIGGIFIKANDPAALSEWYRRHLGCDVEEWGGVVFQPMIKSPAGRGAQLAWNAFPKDSTYFDPTTASFMINYRVDDLDAVLAALRAEGCDVDDRTDSSEYGKFGWATDPEGNRFELWEPPMAEEAGGT